MPSYGLDGEQKQAIRWAINKADSCLADLYDKVKYSEKQISGEHVERLENGKFLTRWVKHKEALIVERNEIIGHRKELIAIIGGELLWDE